MILTVTLNAAIDKRYVMEEFQLGRVNRVKECVYVPGGKGLNVSKPAAIAGAEVVATGFLGGHAGRFIEDALQPFGITSDFYHVEAESRSCINIWDETNHVQTEILEPGFTLTEAEFQDFTEKFKKLVQRADVITMSGSAPRGLDETVYQELVKICKDAGKKVILDTSGKLLKRGIEACPTMIKPNQDEIRMLTGKNGENPEELLEAAKEIYAAGVEIVVISLGAEGSVVVCDEGVFRAKVPKIDAANTVGCGDSMIAGFALGISQNLSMEETLRLASAISAASALREETGFFVKEDMEQIYPQVQIYRMETVDERVKLFADCHCGLSESPMWNKRDNMLYWRDIHGKVYRKKMGSSVDDYECFPLQIGNIGSMVFTEGEEMLLFADGARIWRWTPGEEPVLYRDFGKNLFNDVIVDPKGRIYCGMLAEHYFDLEKRGKHGSFWRLDPNGDFICLEDNLTPTPNGIRFSPELDRLYFADTEADAVYVYDYDIESGELTNKRVFADGCFPDGIAVDKLGNVWVTYCRPGKPLQCYSPEGKLLEEIYFPVNRVISVAFGGPDGTDMFVTTDEGEQPVGAHDGGVFVVLNMVGGAEEYVLPGI